MMKVSKEAEERLRMNIRRLSAEEAASEKEELMERVPEQWRDLLDNTPKTHQDTQSSNPDDDTDFLNSFDFDGFIR